MAVRWESLRGGVVLLVVVAAFGWATLWPVARTVGARGVAPQEAKRVLVRDAPMPASERRVALVVGNGGYGGGNRLENAVNDAVDMAEVLAGYGFEVIKAVDVGREGLYQQIRAFGRRLRAGSGSEVRVVGLFYYAGHGIQVEGRNYLVPVGAERQMREEEDVGVYCVEVGEVLKQMGEGGSQVNIVILDACRDNPYARSWRRSGVDGLAEMSAPKGTLMAYATDPGKTAKDVGEGRNGLYTGVLLKWLRAAPEQDVRRLLDEVGKEVERKSGGKQQPWVASKLRDAFSFRPAEVAVGGGEKPVETPVGGAKPGGDSAVAGEAAAWKVVEGSEDPKDVEAFLKLYPNGVYAGAARVKLEMLERRRSAGGAASGGVGVSAGARPPAGARAGQVWASPAGIRLVWIPAGEYEMGSNNGESNEKPVHRVRLTQGYWLGETEVTQRQWEAVMGGNPSHFKDCPECPVEMVSWEDCRRFVSELNARYPVGGGLVWRLPYEAEWEYACRAGTRSDYFGGDGEGVLGALGWYLENSGRRANPVKRLRANGWGLYDMHGNVWEWCEDWYGEDYYRISPVEDPRGPGSGEGRVLRGGAWSDGANGCRAAYRDPYTPAYRFFNLGLRVAVGAP